MDSLANILHNKDLDEPTEVSSLRSFVEETFEVNPTIKINQHNIVIFMPNAALASKLRMQYQNIQTRCQLTRKLVIRIGRG